MAPGQKGFPDIAHPAASPPHVAVFEDCLKQSADTAVAVAAIKALTSVIRRSTATTMMQLDQEMKQAAEALRVQQPTSICLQAACELFLRYVTRTSVLEGDWEAAKQKLIERGEQFARTSRTARQTISELGERYIPNGARVLVHGHSRAVLALLKQAKIQGSSFSVAVTEGQPDQVGLEMERDIVKEVGVAVTVIADAGVAYMMERIDMVLVGAEAVVNNGGIVNKLGTYTIAIAAKALNVPFYVAVESFKFAQLNPLRQRDLPVDQASHIRFLPLLSPKTTVDIPTRDYTPASYITLLFTDLGVLTPAAVSDELFQLYQ